MVLPWQCVKMFGSKRNKTSFMVLHGNVLKCLAVRETKLHSWFCHGNVLKCLAVRETEAAFLETFVGQFTVISIRGPCTATHNAE